MTGYYTQDTRFSVRYKEPEYKKDKVTYMPKLFHFDEAQVFIRKRSKEVDRLFKEAVDKVLEAHFTINMGFTWDDEYVICLRFVLAVTEKLSNEEKEILEAIGKKFQKKLAKEFNKQPFTETEYGFAKMPSTQPYGWSLIFGPINPQDILDGIE